jgi:hypothetical protein
MKTRDESDLLKTLGGTEGIMEKLKTSPKGIDSKSIESRKTAFGENKLDEPATKSFIRIFLEVYFIIFHL